MKFRYNNDLCYHDQIEAMTMSRIVVMKDGYIQQVGAPKEIMIIQIIFLLVIYWYTSMNFIHGKFTQVVNLCELPKPHVDLLKKVMKTKK